MTKVISLSNKAYDILKSQKEGKESFSDVVLRLSKTRKQKPLSSFCGLWKGTNWDEIKKELEHTRKTAKMREVTFR